nr:MAG TPA: hypothetical protein [Caudoviricetes sp.]
MPDNVSMSCIVISIFFYHRSIKACPLISIRSHGK